jgi:hypothetical protein
MALLHKAAKHPSGPKGLAHFAMLMYGLKPVPLMESLFVQLRQNSVYWRIYLFTHLSTKLVTCKIKRILFVTVPSVQVDSFQENTAHRTVSTVSSRFSGPKARQGYVVLYFQCDRNREIICKLQRENLGDIAIPFMAPCTMRQMKLKSIPQGLKAQLILLGLLPGINPRPTFCATAP